MKSVAINFPGKDNFVMQEAFKVLRSNIQFCGNDVKVVSITSCHENEGKSTITLGLAKSFAELGKKVLVIDADMRKSVMAGRNSNASNVKGLSEILSGLASLEECLYRTQYELMDIVFAGRFPPNPVELLSSPQFAKLVGSAREVYDYVFIDNAPIGLVIDCAVVAPICDGTAIVINDDDRYRNVKKIINQLEKGNGRLLGIIRNRIHDKKRKLTKN